MVLLEKLSLFNINHLRKLYNRNEDAYICGRSFFEIYDEESFLIKYVIRKQIKLFKVDNEYVGYIWYENPCERGYSTIYSIYLKDEYVELLTSKVLSFFNTKNFKFEMMDNSRSSKIMQKLKFNINSKNILMHLNLKDHKYKRAGSGIFFRHFKEGEDEELRCKIQNSVFNEKNRIPLTVEDVYNEEKEEYYINNFGVFICNKEGRAVGYGQIIFSKGLYTIVNLGILGEYRQQGFGEMLVNYLIEFCHKNSIKDVYIRVDRNNFKALSLYKKIGFKEYQSFVTWSKSIY
ncbi:N-acetyltransferase [Clostridium sp.]|uniref:GNAT family N-acetyltransferase n=1 Tax=Clostridium sp. TaxID=1506 RepID=UPI00263071AD|nr:GNAT family N-acetyltransferase [Clostridium sp.]